MLKKKNMAMIMAGVTVATSVAPAFANNAEEVVEQYQNYKVNAKDSAKLIEEVRKAFEVKFQDTKLGVTVGDGVYDITVGGSKLVNATQLQNKINSLADGATLDVVITDKGHQVIDGKIANYKYEKYETVTEITKDINESKVEGLTATIKSTDTVEVKSGEDVVLVKVGDDKLDFTAPIMKDDKLVGFEKEAIDIEDGITYTITVKKTDAVFSTVNVEDLYDGIRLTQNGQKILDAKKAGEYSISFDENNYTIVPGFSNSKESSIDMIVIDEETKKETDVITIVGELDLINKFQKLVDGEISEDVEVLAGDDRFETSIKVSEKSFTDGTAKAVVLVGKDAVVDGLAAAPLAAAKEAPILLANKDGLTEEVEAEMLRVLGNDLSAKTIYIVGGESQISKETETQIAKLGVKVKRLSGDDRYETSLAIAKELNSASKKRFVVGGNGEVDAMSIASYAAEEKAPIIVTNKDVVSEEAIKVLEGKQIEIVGGTSSVSAEVETELDKIDMDKAVVRIAGNDRQETNAKVINRYYGDATEVFVAKDGYGNGTSHLIDALTAAPLAGSKNAPIVLATNDVSTAQVETAELKLKNVTKMTQIGQGIAKTVVEKLGEVLNLF